MHFIILSFTLLIIELKSILFPLQYFLKDFSEAKDSVNLLGSSFFL